MEIKDFAEKVRGEVEKTLGEDYKIEIREVRKNNGITLHGMLILTDCRNVIPTLYLEPYWEAYEAGVALGEIVRRLIKIYREDMPETSIDMDFFRKFDGVAERVCYRLIRQEGNAKLLEDIPYIPFLDLAICFFYAYSGEALGEGSILIHNSHAELWGVTTKMLLEVAQKNTPALFPWQCCSMEQVLREMAAEGDDLTLPQESGDKELFLQENALWVLSNRQRAQGACGILYPGLLEQLAQKAGKSFYILPSSVHEVILLPDRGIEKPQRLKDMISEVNMTQVAPEEVLSDSLYYYDFREGNIRILA